MVEQRIDRLRTLCAQHHLPALLVTNPVNRRYLTGFTGTAGYVLITEDRAILLTDFRYMTQASEQVKHVEVMEHRPKVQETIKDILVQCNITKLGFEQHDLTYGTYQVYKDALDGIEMIPIDGLVEQLRMIKDDEELRIIEEAAELVDRTFSHILKLIKPGITEKEVAFEIEMYLRKHGATSSSFDTIVASGERSALPHGVASDRVLQNNELITLDFGAYYKGYCSDITRTIVLGQAQEKHREIYQIVLEAQMNALERIRPGMTGKEADALTRDIIKRYGYSEYFGHGTGHGIGLEIHEAPRLSFTSDTILKPGMTVTVEPGIYLPGIGGVRIEDDVVITETGVRILTRSTKELICID